MIRIILSGFLAGVFYFLLTVYFVFLVVAVWFFRFVWNHSAGSNSYQQLYDRCFKLYVYLLTANNIHSSLQPLSASCIIACLFLSLREMHACKHTWIRVEKNNHKRKRYSSKYYRLMHFVRNCQFGSNTPAIRKLAI